MGFPEGANLVGMFGLPLMFNPTLGSSKKKREGKTYEWERK